MSRLGSPAWPLPATVQRQLSRWTSAGSAARKPVLARGASTAAPHTDATATMYLFGSFRNRRPGPSSIRRLLIMRTLTTSVAGLTRADRLRAGGHQMDGSDYLSMSNAEYARV